MPMKPIRITLAACCLTSAAISTPSLACATRVPLVLEDIARADMVFTGKIVDFQRISPGEPGSLDDYGLVTVAVEHVLRGPVPRKVTLYWWNSTFGIPEALDRPETLLFATVSADQPDLPLRGPSATTFPSRRPDLPQLLQAPCATPFMLADTEDLERRVRAILATRG